jgi:WD40 repeat protein
VLAFAGKDRSVVLWDGARVTTLTGATGAIRRIVWSPDGRLVAAGCDDGVVRVWSPRTGRIEREFAGHEGRVWDLAWHPDGQVLLAASHQVRLHRLRDGKSLTLRARVDQAAGIVHTRAGYFDGDPSAFSLLVFRQGAHFRSSVVLEADAAERAFHRSGLAREFW